MPQVSVIVPVYNVEKYLEKCLDSLVNQTLKDIEIILVNDNSKDSSLDILNKYSNQDSRIKLINFEKNYGPSKARNEGLKIAKGEYISFVDSDDWVDEDYFEKLLNAIISNNCDIAVSTIIRKRKLSQKCRVHYTEEKVYSSLEDKINISRIPVCCYIWNKLYKHEKIKDFKFKEGVFFEDVLWIPEVLKNTDKLVTVPGVNYYYRVNNSSIVKKLPSKKKQEDSYNAHKYIVEFFEENGFKLSKKSKTITKEIIYLLNIPIARIKECGNWNTFYLFNLIPIFKYSKTRYRDFYKFLGLKFTIRKNKKSIKEIRDFNSKFEQDNVSVPIVRSKFETLDKLINSNCSMCRYGDGEFNLIFGENLPFQIYNKLLAKRLKEILLSNDENILVCLPDVFGSLRQYTEEAADFWRKSLYYNRADIEKIINPDKLYYDALVTRPYMEVSDKSFCNKYFENFKKVWEEKSIVIIEGKASRLGIGNDLFDNAKSIKRILCPAKNSYSEYENIFNECLKSPEESLYIIALGPTATILAYDLAKTGRRALDLGHIDIEYEWFRMGATEKVPVKNKYVNECKNGKIIAEIDDKEYLSQICSDFSKAGVTSK